jgi:hypothetical protein
MSIYYPYLRRKETQAPPTPARDTHTNTATSQRVQNTININKRQFPIGIIPNFISKSLSLLGMQKLGITREPLLVFHPFNTRNVIELTGESSNP